MIEVIYDERKWRVVVGNYDCPHLFYPINIHGCKLFGEDYKECTLENCPIRILTYDPVEEIKKRKEKKDG